MQLNLRNPSTQKWIIMTTLSFGLIYAYINFVYMPRSDRADKLAHDIDHERDLLTKGKRIAANFQTVEDDYDRLMQSWKIAQELLPTNREMESLLKSITEEGQKNDVNFMLFRPMDPIEKPYYWENPIQVRTLSTYHDLGIFMSSVASMGRIVNINNMKLSGYKPKKGRSMETVQADFIATIYIFKELGSSTEVIVPDDKTKGKKPKPKPGEESEEPKEKRGKA